jgi:hypothetical protein
MKVLFIHNRNRGYASCDLNKPGCIDRHVLIRRYLKKKAEGGRLFICGFSVLWNQADALCIYKQKITADTKSTNRPTTITVQRRAPCDRCSRI